MLERMTQAEEQGYEEEYFPIVAEEEVTAPHDPSEYILSISPVEPGVLDSVMEPIMEQDEDEASDGGREGVEVAEQWRQEREREHEREREQREREWAESNMVETTAVEAEGAQVIDEEQASQQPTTPISTSPTEPDMQSRMNQSPRKRYPSPPRRRRRSNQNRVAEAVFFSYGVSVFFGFQESEEHSIMEDIKAAGVWQSGADEDDWENEEFHYVVSVDRSSRIR